MFVCEAVNQPGAEVCGDGLDNDCDGTVDNGCGSAVDGGGITGDGGTSVSDGGGAGSDGGLPTDPNHRSGCGCRAGDGARADGTVGLLLGALLLGFAWHRRRH
jgi:MYXO-CTERM domain-containing protein